MRHGALTFLLACGAPAAPPVIHNQPPSPAPPGVDDMTGPFRTAKQACESIKPCTSIHFGSDEDPAPDKLVRDCEWVETIAEAQHVLLHDTQPGFTVHVLELSCMVPRYMPRDVSAGSTHLILQRSDGWWIGPGWFEHDDQRNCGQTLEPKEWTRRGSLHTLSATVERGCWACGKAGNATEEQDLEIVLRPTGARPAAFSPVALGSRSMLDVEPGIPDCPATEPVINTVESRWTGEELVVGDTVHQFR